jgi:hypothetical protein
MTQPTPCETCGGWMIKPNANGSVDVWPPGEPCPDCAAPQAEAKGVGLPDMMRLHELGARAMTEPAAREVVHEQRIVGHASGRQERMPTCVCGKPWPCAGNDISRYAWGNPPFPKYPHETADSMAEIGEAFMDAMPKDYSWCQSPAEVIADLSNKEYDATRLLAAEREKFQPFFDFHAKHGLPPKAKPSCLVCGKTAERPYAIRHAELPHIVVCQACRDSASERDQLQQEVAGLRKIMERYMPRFDQKRYFNTDGMYAYERHIGEVRAKYDEVCEGDHFTVVKPDAEIGYTISIGGIQPRVHVIELLKERLEREYRDWLAWLSPAKGEK